MKTVTLNKFSIYRNGRFASEPLCGLTTLLEHPPPPGWGIQKALCESSPCEPIKPPSNPNPPAKGNK